MNRLAFVWVIIFNLHPLHYSFGRESQLLRENRSIRSLLLLDKNVQIEKIVKGRVYIDEYLTEDSESMKDSDDSDSLALIEKPPDSTCVYFSFDCKLKLKELMSHSSILKNTKLERLSMQSFVERYWIVPKFPEGVLRETDIAFATWYRDDRVHLMYLVASRIGSGDDEIFRYYGCVSINYGPMNGPLPELRFDNEGKVTSKLLFEPSKTSKSDRGTRR
jgi:hypothetical protein